MSVKLILVSLWVEDVPGLVHFYRDVIGLSLIAHHGDRPHFDLGGVYLTILHGKPQPTLESDPEHFPLIAFSVHSLDEAIGRLEAHGIEIPWGISSGTDSRWVMFYDPGGNLIELAERST